MKCLVGFMLLLSSSNLIAQAFDKKQVVDSLAVALEKNYVYLDTAIQMGNYIRQRLKDGAYDEISNPNAFAQQLTTDVRHVYNDVHFSINYSSQPTPPATSKNNRAMAAQENFGFRKLEILGGNIGYLAFDRFAGLNDDSKETVDAAFTFLKNVNALVIDLRNNGGGSPDMDSYISSFLLPAGTSLSGLYERRTNMMEPLKTSAHELSFGSKPVYILTSSHTFSGGEAFAYDLHNLHRATIIGETTGGGAHAVGPENISNGFTALIPYARAVSPVTGTNWEAVGVKPDIAVGADSTLDVAILEYYNYQLANSNDSAQIKKINWARNMLQAKLHPYPADTAKERTYTGVYGNRFITMEGGFLFYTGTTGKKTKLLQLSASSFKIPDNDNMKIEFITSSAGNITAMQFIFEDGFIANCQKKE